MGTNHGGSEGIEVAGAVEHGGARTCLSFHEYLRKIRCQRRNPAPPMPRRMPRRWARRTRRLVTSSLEAAFDGWREERGRSPPSAPRRRASPARRATAAAAAARRGMVARIVGFWTLEWKVEWSSEEKCGPSKCRDGKKLGLIVYGPWVLDSGVEGRSAVEVPNCQPSDLESAVGRMTQLHQIKISNEMNYIPSKKMKWITSVFLKLTL